MHTTGLRREDFRIEIDGEPGSLEDLFPGFTEHDRLGIVIASDLGGAGAGTLILATVTGFYDRLRAQEPAFFAYPDYFAFHLGHPRGSLRKLDLYPDHKEVVVDEDPEQILRAINDRGVTRLLVEVAGEPGGSCSAPAVAAETVASAQRRIRSSLGYGPTGTVRRGEVVVRGAAQAESHLQAMIAANDELTPDAAQRLRRIRSTAHGGGFEQFRRLSLDEALAALTPLALPL